MITVPRDQMPQIDEKDIPRLLVFLGALGVKILAGEEPVLNVKQHQDINWEKARALADRPKDMRKPILVCEDMSVIDGNHRVAAHLLADEPTIGYIQLALSFEHAIPLLNAFPDSYTTAEVKQERE